MRRYYASEAHESYMRFADSLQSAPFIQDLPQIQALKDDGFIPADSVLCNGNSGDYISGAHIIPAMRTDASGLLADARMRRILDSLIGKHFALWRSLLTAQNRERIAALLRRSLERAGAALGAPGDDFGLYEYAEFQDRQCKYVITGQRIYEFLGHEWRLPLWDKAYLDFWETIPLAGKAEQTLYAEMLEGENWGGVWSDLPVNRKTIRPHWIRPLRFAAKVGMAPLGRERWHRLEKQIFQYWMSATGASAIVPYRRAALDRRGARHGVAWLAEDYLMRHGARLPGDRAEAGRGTGAG
jgi:asparagine synthase (glutamine-hydrolysing)